MAEEESGAYVDSRPQLSSIQLDAAETDKVHAKVLLRAEQLNKYFGIKKAVTLYTTARQLAAGLLLLHHQPACSYKGSRTGGP